MRVDFCERECFGLEESLKEHVEDYYEAFTKGEAEKLDVRFSSKCPYSDETKTWHALLSQGEIQN